MGTVTAQPVVVWNGVRVADLNPDYRPHTAGNRNPCAHCGKELTRPSGLAVHIIRGGMWVLHVEDDAAFAALGADVVAGDMYLHPIGSDCAKKFPGFVHKFEAGGE